MIKRIEFHLNLDDPREAAIYQALKPSLQYRHAGEVIRQALDRLLISKVEVHKPQMLTLFDQQEKSHE
ncbi:MAG: hypothetical protein H0X30_18165 [Anaerolineae bacterium]|nr:hypothetical protein [Anaerolineae bacterium]